jgi:hypothetical protein
MKCNSIQKWLPLYAGRDLDFFRSRMVEKHIGLCNACRSEYEAFVAVRRISRQTILSRTPDWESGIWPKLALDLESIPNRSHGKTGRKRYPRLAYSLAGIALAIFLFLWIRPEPFRKARSTGSVPGPTMSSVVEEVHMPGVTVVTFETDDPNFTIVWFFQDKS